MSLPVWPNKDIVLPENRGKLDEWFKSYAAMGACNTYAYICRSWERAAALENSKVNNDPNWA